MENTEIGFDDQRRPVPVAKAEDVEEREARADREGFRRGLATGHIATVARLGQCRNSASRTVYLNAMLHVLNPTEFPVARLAAASGVSERRMREVIQKHKTAMHDIDFEAGNWGGFDVFRN